MIKDRRKTQTKESKRGPKKTATADRSIATGRAKREAAMKAKRGLTQSKKPTKMEVEKEVKRQNNKTVNEKKRKEKKASGGRIAPDSSARNKKKKEKKAAEKKTNSPPPAIFGGRAPPKKAIEAAIKGMETAGFKIPSGYQMVMTFVPGASPSPAPAAKGKKGNNTKSNGTNTKGNTKNTKSNTGGRRKK